MFIHTADKDTKYNYMVAMELNRHSIAYDRGMDVFPHCVLDSDRKKRAEASENLEKRPGIQIANTDPSYINWTRHRYAEHIPLVVTRLYGYFRERLLILDSMSHSDIMHIFMDSDCANDNRIVTTEQELDSWLKSHYGNAIFLYYI